MLAGAGVSPETLREDIQATKARTSRPFGVNFLLAPEPGNRDEETVQRFLDRFREGLGLSLGEGISRFRPRRCRSRSRSYLRGEPVLSTALGDPGDLIGSA